MQETLIETVNTSTDWSLPVLVGAGVLAVAVIVMTWFNLRQTRSRLRRWMVLLLRTSTVVLLMALLLEPVKREQLIRRVRSHVVVLVDHSESMAVPLGEETRMSKARSWLSAAIPGLKEDHTVHLYTFGDGPERWPKDKSYGEIKATAHSSHILESLSQIAGVMAGKDLSVIILITDGVDNGALHWLQKGRGKLVREVRLVLDRLGAPIHAVDMSGAGFFSDVRLVDLRYPSFTYVMNAASLNAKIEVLGTPPPVLRVTLYEDGKPIRTEKLPIIPGNTQYDVSLPFRPRQVGERVYTVRVAPGAGERYLENNERSALVPCIRDRIRVLQVAGHPSYDQRFLREYLKSNSNVDLVSFFILVDATEDVRFNSKETSLIPFPVRELFEDELPGFDLVIFQDFEYQPFGAGAHLDRIKTFVKEGGAFLVIGGERSFERGKYEGTAMADLLPVELSPVVRREDPRTEVPFRPVVTETGKTHPVLRLLPDELENRQLFRVFPKLYGMNRVGPAKEGAVELLVHPTLKSMNGRRLPLLALGEFGEGRIMTLATDSIWTWNFKYAGRGGDVHPYNRFWTASISWLMGDPEMNPVFLSVNPQTPRERTEVFFNTRIADPSFHPAPNKEFALKVYRQVDATNQRTEVEVLSKRDLKSDGAGEARVPWMPPGPGVYRVELRVQFGTRELKAERVFVVDPGSPERSRIYDTEELLSLLTTYTEGDLHNLDMDPERLSFRTPDTLLLARERERPLWNRGFVLFLAVFLLGLEWAIRKRAGLP